MIFYNLKFMLSTLDLIVTETTPFVQSRLAICPVVNAGQVFARWLGRGAVCLTAVRFTAAAALSQYH